MRYWIIPEYTQVPPSAMELLFLEPFQPQLSICYVKAKHDCINSCFSFYFRNLEYSAHSSIYFFFCCCFLCMCSSTCNFKMKTYDLWPNSVHLLSCTYLFNLNWKASLPIFKNKSRASAEYCVNKSLISFLLLKKIGRKMCRETFMNDLSAS